MNSKKKPLLLDFDGVICNSVGEQYRAASAVLESFGVKKPSRFQSYRNMTRFLDWFDSHSATQTASEFEAAYWSVYQPQNCPVMRHAVWVLQELREKFDLVIISSAKEEYVKGRLIAFGIDHFFESVHTGQDRKVETIKSVCDQMCAAYKEVFFVGDMRSDVDCGNAAGVQTILIAPRSSPHGTYANRHLACVRQLRTLL